MYATNKNKFDYLIHVVLFQTTQIYFWMARLTALLNYARFTFAVNLRDTN